MGDICKASVRLFLGTDNINDVQGCYIIHILRQITNLQFFFYISGFLWCCTSKYLQ